MRVSVTVVGGASQASAKLSVRVDSSQTVEALRGRIWQHLGEWQPSSADMLRMITQGRELKEGWRTLGELKLRAPYGVHVMRRQDTSAQKAADKAGSAGGGGDADAAPMDDRGASGDAAAGGAAVAPLATPASMLADEGDHFRILFELLALPDGRLVHLYE